MSGLEEIPAGLAERDKEEISTEMIRVKFDNDPTVSVEYFDLIPHSK